MTDEVEFPETERENTGNSWRPDLAYKTKNHRFRDSVLKTPIFCPILTNSIIPNYIQKSLC